MRLHEHVDDLAVHPARAFVRNDRYVVVVEHAVRDLHLEVVRSELDGPADPPVVGARRGRENLVIDW